VESLLSIAFTADNDGDADIQSCIPLFENISDDEVALLMSDLHRKVLDESPGPLSFQRITKVDHTNTNKKSAYLDLLTAPSSTSGMLVAFAAYGKVLMQPCLPHSTRRAGAALFAGAKSALAIHFGRTMSDSVRDLSAKVLAVIN
jgi:hypothetical protein